MSVPMPVSSQAGFIHLEDSEQIMHEAGPPGGGRRGTCLFSEKCKLYSCNEKYL